MCPLRVLLIFLSATLAGFFVLRNLKAQTELNEEQAEQHQEEEGGRGGIPKVPVPFSTKVRSAIESGFWTFVDMASGRYLWRILMAPAAAGEKKAC